MTLYPVDIAGQRYGSVQELVAELVRRARNGVVDHPGQWYPVEALADARRAPHTARALADACARLIPTSTELDVLQLCAHIGGAGHRPYYEAVLTRLDEGPPLPREPAAGGRSIDEELANTLSEAGVREDPELTRRALRTMRAAGLHGPLLLLAYKADPDEELAALLVEALAQPAPRAAAITLGAWALAQCRPDELLEVAAASTGTPEALRAAIAERVAAVAPEWWRARGAELRAALGVG